MKRSALAAAVLVCCWLSVSLAQQIDGPKRPTERGVLILDPDNPPEERSSIDKRDVGDDFLSALEVGQSVAFESGVLRVLTTDTGSKIAKVTPEYIEVEDEHTVTRVRTSSITAIQTYKGAKAKNQKPH